MPSNPRPPPRFSGFTPRTLKFLYALSQHNDRDWFQANRAHYEEHVVTPALDFIEAMADPLAGISPRFLCIPKRVGGSLIRIFRDTRFAHDKRPYKTNIGIHFRHEAFRDIHAPGYYFHIGLDECFIGCGMWHPERPVLNEIRRLILDRPRRWTAARRAVTSARGFAFFGDTLKRMPADFPVPAAHPWRDDFKRKDFIVARSFDEAELYSPALVDFAAESYAAATPFMRFLCASQGARFD